MSDAFCVDMSGYLYTLREREMADVKIEDIWA